MLTNVLSILLKHISQRKLYQVKYRSSLTCFALLGNFVADGN